MPVGPYDHCKASLSASPTPYFMSVHSFIQLIFIELPQGNWQRDNALYWTNRREDPMIHLTPSVWCSGGILNKNIACDVLSLMMKLIVLEGLLSQDWLQGFSIQLFISTPASSRWKVRLYQWSADYTGAYRPLGWSPAWLEPRNPAQVAERHLSDSECAETQLVLVHKANFIINFYSIDQFLLTINFPWHSMKCRKVLINIHYRGCKITDF